MLFSNKFCKLSLRWYRELEKIRQKYDNYEQK